MKITFKLRPWRLRHPQQMKMLMFNFFRSLLLFSLVVPSSLFLPSSDQMDQIDQMDKMDKMDCFYYF